MKGALVVLLIAAACGAAPRGRAAYLVTAKDDTPAGRQALRVALGAAAAGDDVSGDGFVVRLDDAARARVASMPEVGAVAPLAPDARHGAIPPGDRLIIHVDLFDDATAAEADEVAAWLRAHGATVGDRAPTWIDARAASATAIAAASLPAVRWVEGRVLDSADAPSQ